ncbi:MAG: hypothetical protein AMXMBFR46_17330 [Acidimicrobiia bacterium]
MGFREYPVRVGSMLYTQVDPERGHEVEYNRWYERDHFYAGCMIGPWLFAGRRWVAPRDLKDLRFPADTPFVPDVRDGSYVAIYWIHDDHYDDHVAWATEQVNWLYSHDRGFANRVHAHTGMYFHLARWYRDDDPIPLELALDKPEYTGMVSLAVQPAPGVDTDAALAWFDAQLPEFLTGSPVANVSAWRSAPLLDDAPAFVPRDPEAASRVLQLYHLEADPRDHWDRFRAWAATIDDSGILRTIWCGPWIPTVLGTDTYTDQLW